MSSILTATVAKLKTISAVVNLLGFVDNDPDPDDPWIFASKPGVKIEGSGKAALVVVGPGGSWTSPVNHKTLDYPRVNIECWADPTRDSDNNITARDADEKALAILQLVSRSLHIMDGSDTWGDARIIGSQKLADPFEMEEQGLVDGMCVWRQTYGIIW